jgi:pyridinium-3,5-bisthiocarboxylic acid mononucleotide nickel chelatase
MGHEGHDHEHHGDHAHDHEHHGDHDHDHDHDHDPSRHLERNAGQGKLLFLDAPSGLAGDMIIAALVDLGVPRTVVAEAIASLPITGFHLHFGTRTRSGVVATSFDVHEDAPQPPRTYAAVRALVDAARCSDAIKTLTHRTFLRLAEAEAKVHRMPLDDVHFHEVGAIDSIADVVGSAAALDYLGAKLHVSPLPMGRGFVKAAHGTLPLPAPATVECLVGLETFDAGVDFEFVTPTGGAIVGAHAERPSVRWPRMVPLRVGWGAGTKELKDRPNLLRAVLGELAAIAPDSSSHVVLETNVDDATGELAAATIEAVLAAGALDVWATPITMKKGRPALTLSAIATAEMADSIAHAMLRETTSLGLRRYPVDRVERPRRFVEVATPYGPIPVKVSEGPFGPPQVKPEFDACAAAAKAHGVPVREVLRAALAAYR